MRRAAALVAVLCVSSRANATSGTALAETSRAAALSNAVSARPGDAGTILLNPAGLADVKQPTVLFTGNFARLEQSFTRTGEQPSDRGRWLGGFGLAAATPLPGPLWRIRLGFALDTPAEHALRVAVPTRVDAPTSPFYDGRPDRISSLFAIAAEITDRLKLGGGLAITPVLDTPTEVTYVAGRDKSVDKSVVIRLDRDLKLEVSPFIGGRIQFLDELALAVVYRGASISRARGGQRTMAGGILADDPIDFFQMWDPSEMVLGAMLGSWKGLSLSLDVTFHGWSEMKTGFNTDPTPKLHDTLSLRSGLEWHVGPRWLTIRSGWAVEPSPLPEQTADTNFLGSSTIALAGGAGIDLRHTKLRVPVLVDAHVRGLIGKTQSSHKDPNALSDASSDLPGKQIDNLGYPSFRSSASAIQLGATVTFLLGKPVHP
jgi:hypothetical protein